MHVPTCSARLTHSHSTTACASARRRRTSGEPRARHTRCALWQGTETEAAGLERLLRGRMAYNNARKRLLGDGQEVREQTDEVVQERVHQCGERGCLVKQPPLAHVTLVQHRLPARRCCCRASRGTCRRAR